MNVLSLFDGMSCGRIALERNGVKVSNYYASEVDKYAITVSTKNYPDIIQLGDVTKWREWDIDFASIDLLIGGSPCQGFSFAGGQLAFNDPRSKLFFVYADILNHVMGLNPNVKFLLENVKMKKESEDVITMCVSVEPIAINSALVSAQNRNRLYWTNIEGVEQPEDKGILLKDIIHETEILESELSEKWIEYIKRTADVRIKKKYTSLSPDKAICMTARQFANWSGNFVLCVPEATKKGFCEVGVGECVDLTFLNSKTRRGRLMNDKSNCLTAANYEYNLLESLKEHKVSFSEALQVLDNEIESGKVNFFRKDSQSNRVYFLNDKKNRFYTLTNDNNKGVLIEGYIRKLTPIECERLQTVPDNYTEGVSNSQRYRMLGNGWTVDVICHILRNM